MGVTKQANVCVGLPGSLLQLCQTKLYMERVAVGIKHRFAAQFGCAPGGQVAALPVINTIFKEKRQNL